MTEETQQNKIKLVKDMVLNKCLNNEYIRKLKNSYVPNKKKDLLEMTKSLPPNIYEELSTHNKGINYVLLLHLLRGFLFKMFCSSLYSMEITGP